MTKLSIAWQVFVLLTSASSCTPQRPQPDAAQPASSSVVVAAPVVLAPVQRGECPLTIVPGVSLGPIRIGALLTSLEATGLPLAKRSTYSDTDFVEAGPFHVRACGGIIAEAWIEDLRVAPDCVKVGDKRVDRTLKRQAFEAMFDACHDTPPRIGGAFTECEGGSVRIGYGMGDFIQVRVGRPGSSLDQECADVLDDGGALTLVPHELAKLVQQTLDIDRLAPFWHPDNPGREPLRLVRSPFLASIAGPALKPTLMMFGSKVEWIEPSATKDGRPYFEFTKLEATKRGVELHFRYPVEGLIGSVVFLRRHDAWVLQTKNVAER